MLELDKFNKMTQFQRLPHRNDINVNILFQYLHENNYKSIFSLSGYSLLNRLISLQTTLLFKFSHAALVAIMHIFRSTEFAYLEFFLKSDLKYNKLLNMVDFYVR